MAPLLHIELFGLWQSLWQSQGCTFIRSQFPLSSPLTLGHRRLMWNPISKFHCNFVISPESGLEFMTLWPSDLESSALPPELRITEIARWFVLHDDKMTHRAPVGVWMAHVVDAYRGSHVCFSGTSWVDWMFRNWRWVDRWDDKQAVLVLVRCRDMMVRFVSQYRYSTEIELNEDKYGEHHKCLQ